MRRRATPPGGLRALAPGGLRALALGATLASSVACPGDDGDDGPAPDFPASYADDYVEVRNCRGSGDHDLNNIRVLVDPGGQAAYEGRTAPFPEGTVVLKEEHEFSDTTCSGPVVQWTVMRKLAEGSAPDTLGWAWQTVDPERHVVDVDEPRCIGCHQGCGVPPDGYDWTCALP